MAVTAKNTLTIVGQYSPRQATLGYQPGLPPDIDDEMFDSVSRRTHRLREIVVQGMIEVIVQKRMGRALNSKTRKE
eukprot:6452252-Prorocentrum_lima.AAC.1